MATTLVLAACTEREPESTTGPEFAPSTDACGFSNSLVTGYFPGSRQSYMLTVKSSMASAGQAAQKRTFGFQMMDSIGSVSRNTAFSIDPAKGAQLTIAIIGCIFPDNSFTYPTNALSDFTKALNSAAGGAYYVRGGGSAGRSATILGTTTPLSASGNLSGIAPSTGSTAANWTSMLSGNGTSVGQGVLFYGYDARPVPTGPLLYEWATVPSALTFNPTAVVSVCDQNPANPVVHEEAVGVLFFVSSTICDTQQSLAMTEGWGPKALAARLGRVLADALMPATLQATMLITSGGGKTSTLPKSKFGKKSLAAVNVAWKDDPIALGSTWNGISQAQARPVSAFVSAQIADDSREPVRFCAYLTGANNNGTPTALKNDRQPAAECGTAPNGDLKALSVLTTPDPNDATQALADFGNVWV
ncbi:MAG TPA: hypothetical protein VFZ90_02330, partial [Gemmatimonadales bacterium]